MKFYFDIDLDEYLGEDYRTDFKKLIMSSAVQSIADNLYDSELIDNWRSAAHQQISEIIKSKSDEICNAVIERVSSKVANKKTIMEITPKVSELIALDKDNALYFESLIDKAIAKKFK